jgi:hypothetical protein
MLTGPLFSSGEGIRGRMILANERGVFQRKGEKVRIRKDELRMPNSERIREQVA